MKSIRFATLCVGLGLSSFSQITLAQNASDNATNYTSGWTNGANGGTGFRPWALTFSGIGSNSYGGVELLNPADSGIGGMNSPSFALYADPQNSGAYANAERSISNSLTIGQTLQFQWGINFDSGSANGGKGIDLFAGSTQVFNIQSGNNDRLSLNNTDIGFGYGTNAMTWSFSRISTNTIRVSANPRSGSGLNFTTNINVESGALDRFKFYAYGLQPGSSAKPYFNNFSVQSTPAGLDTNPPTIALASNVSKITLVATNGTVSLLTNDVTTSDLGGGSVSVSFSPTNVVTTSNNLTKVTYTATDAAGYRTSITRVVAVGDAEPNWRKLHYPRAVTINTTDTTTVYGRIFIDGATPDAGQAPNVTAELGVNTTNTDPSTWTGAGVWRAATYNAGFTGGDDEYQATVDGSALPARTYYYAYRFKIGNGVWRYAGINAAGTDGGPWDATNNGNGVLTVDQTIASDSAGNYSGGWTNGANGGTGFNPWALSSGNGAGGSGTNFIGIPTNAGVTGISSNSFGLSAGTNNTGAFSDAVREFSNFLAVGQTLSFKWAINYDSGPGTNASKGVVLSAGSSEIFNINNGGSSAITLNGANVSTNYGTAAMTWSFTRKATNSFRVAVNQRDGSGTYSTNITVTNGAIDKIKFYAYNMQAGAESQPYFNDLLITTATADVINPTIKLATNVANLIWVAKNGTNNPVNSDVTVDDNSGVAPTISISPTNVNTASNGLIKVTYRATDASGNFAEVTRVVAVGDAVPNWRKLYSPQAASINTTNTTTVYGRIYIEEATPGAGQAPNVTAELGVNTADTDPSTWTGAGVWRTATYNAGFTDGDDEYQSTINGSALTPGSYSYAYRFKIGNGAWQYAGINAAGTDGGPWDATTNRNGVLTVVAASSGSSFSGWLGSNAPSAALVQQYAFGAATPTNPVGLTSLPLGGVIGTNLTLTYYVRADAQNTNLVLPEFHTNLANTNGWTNSGISVTNQGTTNINGVTVEKRQASVPIDTTNSRKFLRLKISE